MARNAGGTHSLPAGNPVVSGATIDSSDFNDTMSDFSTEITDSLSRSGKGGMSAPLELADGSVSAPGLSFVSDTDTGIYRIGANNIGIGVGGALIVDIDSGGIIIPVGSAADPSLSFAGDEDTGLYRIAANNLGVALVGAKVVDIGVLTSTWASNSVDRVKIRNDGEHPLQIYDNNSSEWSNAATTKYVPNIISGNENVSAENAGDLIRLNSASASLTVINDSGSTIPNGSFWYVVVGANSTSIIQGAGATLLEYAGGTSSSGTITTDASDAYLVIKLINTQYVAIKLN